MVDKELKECAEKFQQFLKLVKPKDTIRDDTFLEKMQSYLQLDGKI
jgi:hypothetical protein